MKAFSVMGRTLKSAYEELFLIVYLSVIWWIGALLIVTAPMCMVGLNRVANRIANYKRVDQEYFWEGARSHIGRSVLLLLFCVGVPPLLWISLNFYFAQQGWLIVFGVLLLWIALLFFMAGQYFYPLFWQQTEPSLKLVLRNGLLLAVRHPFYSILMLLFQLVTAVICFVLVVPLILFLPGLIALCQNFALVGLLQEMDLAPSPPEISGT